MSRGRGSSSESEEDYEIESITGSRTTERLYTDPVTKKKGMRKFHQFRIHWKGYSTSDDTWQFAETIAEADLHLLAPHLKKLNITYEQACLPIPTSASKSSSTTAPTPTPRVSSKQKRAEPEAVKKVIATPVATPVKKADVPPTPVSTEEKKPRGRPPKRKAVPVEEDSDIEEIKPVENASPQKRAKTAVAEVLANKGTPRGRKAKAPVSELVSEDASAESKRDFEGSIPGLEEKLSELAIPHMLIPIEGIGYVAIIIRKELTPKVFGTLADGYPPLLTDLFQSESELSDLGLEFISELRELAVKTAKLRK